METWVIDKIARINQEFYQIFAESFSATRSRIQPGVAKLLNQTPDDRVWLDIGCGNSTLAQAWIEQGRKGIYTGCDLSPALIDEARRKIGFLPVPEGISIEFNQTDLNQENWHENYSNRQWDVISLFAVLHHIPSITNRQSICRSIRRLLPAGNPLYLSVWQLQNSTRLLPRIKPWKIVGIKTQEVEEGDVLMDWRATGEKGSKPEALRYVHLFNEAELNSLALSANFQIEESFYSDGKEGNLALYQVWK
jgi:tRNA (uracil-5-)-methyltransferase TRM9